MTVRRPSRHTLYSKLYRHCHSLFRKRQSSEEGLTLIEVLIAILVVAFAGTAIAPAMVLAVATRVQSQKAEQALELAQSEVDRIRLLIERRDDIGGGAVVDDFPPLADGFPFPANVPAPDGFNCAPSATEGFPVSLDPGVDPCALEPDEQPDFVIQTYRLPGITADTGIPTAFRMGVRVYDFRAFRDEGGGELSSERASLGMTSNEGSRVRAPLAVLYTEVAAGEQGDSFCDLRVFASETGDPSLPLGCR